MEKIVNNCKASVFNDNSSESYDSDISTKNVNKPISFKSEDDFSDNIQHGKWMKEGTEHSILHLLGNRAYRSKFRNPLESIGMLQTIYCSGNS